MTHPAIRRWLARARNALARTRGHQPASAQVHVHRFGGEGSSQALRVLYVANAFIPTLQLSFVKPLQALVDAGELVAELLSEHQMKEMFGSEVAGTRAREWVAKRI